MRIVENQTIYLRDLIPSDIEKRLYWETEETEWQLWDGPWDYEGKTSEQLLKEREDYIKRLEKEAASPLPENALRTRFQIMEKATESYVGWVGSYLIDDECLINENGSRRTIGIDLPDPSSRHKGLGFSAFSLAIEYFFSHGEEELYTQTWSGNIPMQKLAAKLGFKEYRRKKNFRYVRGNHYDGLTFLLTREEYNNTQEI